MTEPALPYDAECARADLMAADPDLGALIRAVGPFRLTLKYGSDPFLGLLRAIVYQQLTGRAAGTIHDRIKALFDNHEPTPAGLIALPDEHLRQAGLSAAKTAAARDLAEKTLAGVVPSEADLAQMDNDTIIRQLTSIRGVGQWTVEMLLIFNLGRADVLPTNDLGIRKGYMATYGTDALPTPAELRARGERWAPWRSVASWYLWRASEGIPTTRS